MTLLEAIDAYIDWRRAHGARFITSARILRQFCTHVGGDIDCDAVGKAEVVVFRGQDAVFRLKRDANAETVAFLAGPLDDATVEIRPDDKALARLKARHPGAAFGPLKLRLVRYAVGDTVFALGTTLAEGDGFAVGDLAAIYKARWRLEDFFRVLKSGCRVEFLLFRTADRLTRAVAINLVIAWRIHLMTLLGRDHPELSPDVLFSRLEIRALRAFVARQRHAPPDTLAGAVLTMARIGGHIHRSRGPPPGTRVIWRGYATLVEWCIGYELMLGQGT